MQSYAFCLRGVTPARMAARSMTVGALWYSDATRVHNRTLVKPMELLDAGFPFLKRALLTKSSNYIERDLVLERLARHGHPLDV